MGWNSYRVYTRLPKSRAAPPCLRNPTGARFCLGCPLARNRVNLNTVVRVDATLAVGATSESVEVPAAASALKTDRADVGVEFTNNTVVTPQLANVLTKACLRWYRCDLVKRRIAALAAECEGRPRL